MTIANACRAAVERLANTRMDMSLEEWGEVSNALLSTAAIAELLFVSLEDFDNWFCDFDPNKQSSRMEGRKVIIRARAALTKAQGEN